MGMENVEVMLAKELQTEKENHFVLFDLGGIRWPITLLFTSQFTVLIYIFLHIGHNS